MTSRRPAAAIVSAPEIRDYAKINAEVVERLNAGCTEVKVQGVAGQRLLLAGLRGSWNATIEIEGDAGPELAAGLDAPDLLVVCKGGAGDGAGSGMRSGRLLVLGPAGDAIGYNQAGGTIVAAGAVSHRAGLRQAEGTLVLMGETGRLAGDRQTGGLTIARDELLGPRAGRGRQGGGFVRYERLQVSFAPGECPELADLGKALAGLEPWLAPRTP